MGGCKILLIEISYSNDCFIFNKEVSISFIDIKPIFDLLKAYLKQ